MITATMMAQIIRFPFKGQFNLEFLPSGEVIVSAFNHIVTVQEVLDACPALKTLSPSWVYPYNYKVIIG